MLEVAWSSAGIVVVMLSLGIGDSDLWISEKRCLSFELTIWRTSSKVTFRERMLRLLSFVSQCCIAFLEVKAEAWIDITRGRGNRSVVNAYPECMM